MEGAELLPDLAVALAAMHGDDAADGQVAEGGRDLDFLARGGTGGLAIRRAEAFVDVARKGFHRRRVFLLARLADDDEGRKSERIHADDRVETLPLLPTLVTPSWHDPATGTVRL